MIKTVGVVGAGTMGNGIAQVVAQAGYDVIIQDIAQKALDKARATIEKSLAKFVEKGKDAKISNVSPAKYAALHEALSNA